ncbi:isochorismatase family protein [Pseudomonas aeruginosa]
MSARQPKRALLVIDVQNEYVSGNLRIEFPSIQSSLERIGAAMDAAHAAGIPIVVVQHLAPADSPLFARGSPAGRAARGGRLAALPAQGGKATGQFLRRAPGWPDRLRERDIDTLAVVGYMTQHCDDSTIRQAIHEGWQVEYLHDASGSVPYRNRAGQASAEEIHRIFGIVLQSSFAAVLSTEEWLESLAGRHVPERDNIYDSNQRALANR